MVAGEMEIKLTLREKNDEIFESILKCKDKTDILAVLELYKLLYENKQQSPLKYQVVQMSFDDEDIKHPEPAARKSTVRASKTKSNRSSHNKENQHARIDSMKSENIQTSVNESRNILNISNPIQVNK